MTGTYDRIMCCFSLPTEEEQKRALVATGLFSMDDDGYLVMTEVGEVWYTLAQAHSAARADELCRYFGILRADA